MISREENSSDPTVIWKSSIPVYSGGDSFIRFTSGAWGDPRTASDHGFRTFVTPFIVGDFNGNGAVGGADLSIWQQAYGQNNSADADNDGGSDGADFLAWQSNVQPLILNGDFATGDLSNWQGKLWLR